MLSKEARDKMTDDEYVAYLQDIPLRYCYQGDENLKEILYFLFDQVIEQKRVIEGMQEHLKKLQGHYMRSFKKSAAKEK